MTVLQWELVARVWCSLQVYLNSLMQLAHAKRNKLIKVFSYLIKKWLNGEIKE